MPVCPTDSPFPSKRSTPARASHLQCPPLFSFSRGTLPTRNLTVLSRRFAEGCSTVQCPLPPVSCAIDHCPVTTGPLPHCYLAITPLFSTVIMSTVRRAGTMVRCSYAHRCTRSADDVRMGRARDATGRDGTGRDGTRRDGTRRDETRRDGTRRDGMGWNDSRPSGVTARCFVPVLCKMACLGSTVIRAKAAHPA